MLVEITKVGREERPCVTSLDVAQTFGKSHQHVLRDVRSLECSDEFRLSNFGQSSYVNAQGKNQPMVVMTRDGFTLLVMGYNGKLAMKFKEAYIKQFNAMESVLRKKMIARERGRASREFLTDSIQQSDEYARARLLNLYQLHLQGAFREIRGSVADGLRHRQDRQSPRLLLARGFSGSGFHGTFSERFGRLWMGVWTDKRLH